MSDLIDQQAAIDAMRRLEQEDIETYGAKIPEGFDAEPAVEALKALPSAQQWIPVTERLPDTYRMVLVCNDDRKIAVAQYVGDDGFWPWKIAYCPYDVDVWDDSENGPVMAWMELPKPWKENADE